MNESVLLRAMTFLCIGWSLYTKGHRWRCKWGWNAARCSATKGSFLIPKTLYLERASLVAQLVKNLPALRETWVRSLGWGDSLEKGNSAHSSILAWRIPWTVVSMGSQRVGHDWEPFTFCLEKPQSRSDYQVQIQLLSPVSLFVTPWTAAHQANLSITNSWSLLKLMSVESVIPSNDLILCCPLLLPHSIFPSIRIFSNESVLCIRWSEYWSFTFSISPSSEYSGLISLRTDWLDLLTVQGTLKSLLQHHCSKASILWLSAFFLVQLSHPHMTTGKTIALTRRTFVGKIMSLLFNMLSRLVTIFLPRSKHLLILCLQSPSAVISEPPKIKPLTVPIVSPSICYEVMGPDVMILVFWMLNFKPTFSLSSLTFIKRLFSSSLLSAIRVIIHLLYIVGAFST